MLLKPEVVNETYKTDDLLDFSEYIKDLHAIVDNSVRMSLIGIVGPYGSGKSVMLESFRKKLRRKHKWVHIDAWKYPDRSDLWEGFVLDFARQVKPKQFKKVLSRLDGTSKDGLRTFIQSIGIATSLVLPGSDKAIDKLTYFAQSSPAKRIFQIQDIFKSLLSGIKETVFIVVEDVDRSGDAGIYFIETLNQFLKDLSVKNTIKVLIPIAETSFNGDKQQAYVKALDYIEFFDVELRDLGRFVDEVFSLEITTNDIKRDHILETLQRLLNNNGLTYRQLKLVIRNADLKHRAIQAKGLPSDPRIVLGIEASRFITNTNKGSMITFADMRSSKYIEHRTQLGLLLYAILRNETIGNTANFLGDVASNHTTYREAIVFVDHTTAPAGVNVSTPFKITLNNTERHGIPLYYIY